MYANYTKMSMCKIDVMFLETEYFIIKARLTINRN